MVYKTRIQYSASEDRLERLIEKRLNANNKKKHEIDEQIWDLFWEDLAIVFTDLSGFSRNVAEFWIIHFIQIIFESERLFIPIIEKYNWILLKVEWDSFMMIFRNPKNAVECSLEMQKVLNKYNSFKEDENEKIYLCLWVWYWRVLKIWDIDVFWEEVNYASKLWEDIAKAWDIIITEAVMEKVKNYNYRFEKIKWILPKNKDWYKLFEKNIL